jgi:hypothetical protein
VFDPNYYLVPPQIDGLKVITLPAVEKLLSAEKN